MGESKKKLNIFERVMDECSKDIEEKDLLKILNASLDMSSQLYLQLFGTLIYIAVLFSQIEPIRSTNDILVTLWYFFFGIGLLSFGYTAIKVVKNNPFVVYNRIFVDYINARTRLREIKK